MKRLIGSVLGLVLLFGSSSYALIGVGVLGAGYSYSGNTMWGYGLSVDAPILPIPLVTSRLETIFISAGGFTLMPVNMVGTYNIPLTPVYVGIGAGVLLYSRTDAGFSAPTAINYNIFVGYEQSLMPMMTAFIQGGYDAMKIEYKIATVNFSADYSGIGVKGGIRIGI